LSVRQTYRRLSNSNPTPNLNPVTLNPKSVTMVGVIMSAMAVFRGVLGTDVWSRAGLAAVAVEANYISL